MVRLIYIQIEISLFLLISLKKNTYFDHQNQDDEKSIVQVSVIVAASDFF